MVPPGQLVHLRLRNRPRVQAGMRRRGGLVLEPVKHVHPRTGRELRGAVAQVRQLAPDYRAPPGITRVTLVGQAR